MTRQILFGLALSAMAMSPAFAADVSGTWLRDTGASRVKFAPCGGAICGNLVWLKPGVETPAKVGQRIFFDMKPSGADSWSGNAFNPEDGKTYSGKMSLSGDTLTTSGCVMGGMICKSTTWTRVN
ncbi:DUF2147 domain-containing protein [Bradyrhizobium prioriisuperbiae]|uniref:DUF2147 domain-containing protein n=1 Tax=Bradyrhizobium prioriisuperbiae TaxID=2854389 RepID=UPI0028EAA4DC|nr:DUF2147 domain-containing protein [Bradyrhizobium prioritasuperba]